MRRPPSLPLRWETAAPPDTLPVAVPPARMAPLRGARPLKRWRYVAAFSDELMLCAATAAVGPARSSWWAVWDRRRGTLHERTRLAGPALVRFDHGGACACATAVSRSTSSIDEGCAVESLNAHGNGYVWTRKQAARAVRGRVVVDGRELALDGPRRRRRHRRLPRARDRVVVVGGRRPRSRRRARGLERRRRRQRRTACQRALRVGRRRLRTRSARCASRPTCRPSTSPRATACDFAAEAVRERHDHLVVVRSDYRQPFGTFAGSLPGVGPVSGGLGVMEHHVARW